MFQPPPSEVGHKHEAGDQKEAGHGRRRCVHCRPDQPHWKTRGAAQASRLGTSAQSRLPPEHCCDDLLALSSIARASPELPRLDVTIERARVRHPCTTTQRPVCLLKQRLEGKLAHALHTERQETPDIHVGLTETGSDRTSFANLRRHSDLRGRAAEIQHAHQVLVSDLQIQTDALGEVVGGKECIHALFTARNGSRLVCLAVERKVAIQNTHTQAFINRPGFLSLNKPHPSSRENKNRNSGMQATRNQASGLLHLLPDGGGSVIRIILKGAQRWTFSEVANVQFRFAGRVLHVEQIHARPS
mmetsp:Transcript_116977/g.331019  ORF Transcript_116977/g.331019 Transcript_116977/m.331019 type:complete len:302 (+) Transcript_116977:688-1593(+)